MVRLKNKTGLVLALTAVLCLPLAAQTNAPGTPAPTTAATGPRTPAMTMAAAAPNMPATTAAAPAPKTPGPTTVAAVPKTPGPTVAATTPKATAATPVATRRKTHPNSKKPEPVTEVPQPPPPPATLEQMPPMAPEVSYRGGQLAINSQNSTLSQVLKSVQAQTGAVIEMPASASNERVVAQLGPGQPRDVINALLNGSK